MLRLLVSFSLIAAPSVLAAGVTEYATGVYSFTPGMDDLGSVDLISNVPCRGSGRPLDLSDALGPPIDKFVTIGSLGSITLSFDHPIEDRPGPDVRVWVSCNIGCEPGSVWPIAVESWGAVRALYR